MNRIAIRGRWMAFVAWLGLSTMAIPASAAAMGSDGSLFAVVLAAWAAIVFLLSIFLTSIGAERSRRKQYVHAVSNALVPSLTIIVGLYWNSALSARVSDSQFDGAAIFIALLAGAVVLFAIIRSHTDA